MVSAKEQFVDSVLETIRLARLSKMLCRPPALTRFLEATWAGASLAIYPACFRGCAGSQYRRRDEGSFIIRLSSHLPSRFSRRERLIRQTDVRHILIKPTEVLSEDAAERLAGELQSRLLSGENFGDLARQYSDDIGSAAEGGELGWTNPGQMVPEFEATMAATPEGTISDPFRSEFGWHILRLKARATKIFHLKSVVIRLRAISAIKNTKKSLMCGSVK